MARVHAINIAHRLNQKGIWTRIYTDLFKEETPRQLVERMQQISHCYYGDDKDNLITQAKTRAEEITK